MARGRLRPLGLGHRPVLRARWRLHQTPLRRVHVATARPVEGVHVSVAREAEVSAEEALACPSDKQRENDDGADSRCLA